MTDFTLKEFPELDSINEADIAPDDEGLVYDASVGVVKRVSKAQGRIDRTVPINSVASFGDIDLTKLTDRQAFFLISFGPSGSHEGGPLYWDENEPRTNHDGRFVFSPTVPAPADFDSASDVQDYRDGVGDAFPGDNGCFIRAGFDQWVIPLNDITSLSSLNTAALVDGQGFKRKNFWPGTGVGGVDLYWDASRPVSEHNGGTIIDPAKISELNTTAKTFGTYFDADTVSGNTGCFVVEDHRATTIDAFGAAGGEPTVDSFLPISAALNSGAKWVSAHATEYATSEEATVPVGVWWMGFSRDTTKIVSLAGLPSYSAFRAQSGSRITDMTIDMADVTDSNGILISSQDGVFVERVRCTRGGFHGIAMLTSTNCRINDVEVDNNGHRGLLMDPNCSDNIVKGIYAHDNVRAGFLIGHGSHHNIVDGFVCEGNGVGTTNAQVWCHNAAYRNQIKNGTIRAGDASAPGLFLQANSYRNQFSNIIIEGHNRGILLRGNDSDAGFPNGNTRYNRFSNIDISGISSSNAESAGVQFESLDAGATKVAYNRFSRISIDTYENGFRCVNGASVDSLENSISDCSIVDDVTNPIRFGGAGGGGGDSIHNIQGYTPFGYVGGTNEPAVPATDTPVLNPFPYTCTVVVSGVEGNVKIDGVNTQPHTASNVVSHTVGPNQEISLVYSTGTPAWRWFGSL